ncbi:MAG: RNA methyltransferase [Candidatus Promineifilaceae bacterium]
MSYFGIGIWYGKHAVNLGTLWRGAYQLGASFIFTIGDRYKLESADTAKAWREIPLHRYPDFDTFWASLPYSCPVVGVEMGGESLTEFTHPERCIYLLGAEDIGLSAKILAKCHHRIAIPAVRKPSFNVAQSGTIVMYDRLLKNSN